MATRTINTARLGRLHINQNAINYDMGNWGLIRHTSDSNPFTTMPDTNSTSLSSYTYTYDDSHGQGEDVDIIFITSRMIYTGNTEYQNSDGTSRIQQYQWNTLNNRPTTLKDVTFIIAKPTTDRIQVNVLGSHGLSVGDSITLSGVATAPVVSGSDTYIPSGSPDINGTYTVTALGGHNGASPTNQFLVTKSMDDSLTTSNIGGTQLDLIYYFNHNASVFTNVPKVPCPFGETINYSTTADRSSHSELVVKCACANNYGAASKANIYIIPRDQLGNDSTVFWALPKLFHQQKGNSRPTLVINSFGDNEEFENLKYIDFRGNRHRTLNGGRSLGSATSGSQNSSHETGFHNHDQYRHYRAADTALINEMTAAGVHHVVSAGNAKHKLDVSGGIDYNNALLKSDNVGAAFSSYYNRATYDTNHSITVGNLNSWFNDGNNTISDTIPFKEVCPYEGEFTNPTSNRGARVDCYVAGTKIITKIPNPSTHTALGNVVQDGTSFSCPILGGLAALVLSKYPTTTPAQLRKYFRDVAVSSVTLSDKVVQPDNSKGDYGDRDYMHHNTSQNSNLKITYVNPALNYDTSQISDTTITYSTETYVTPSSSSSSSSGSSSVLTSTDGNTMTTQKLKAINSMLGHIGESPVNSISSTAALPVSVSTAIIILDEISTEVQSEGWHFNTETGVKYTPTDGVITISEDIIQFDPIDTSVDVVQRGTTLFDRKNNTTTFTSDLTVNQMRLLAWDSLPEVARRYITLKASRVFQGRIIGSRELEALIARDEYVARANLLEADGSTSDQTIFNNYDTSSRVGINRNYDIS